MGRKISERTISILHFINKNGAVDYLQVERALGPVNAVKTLRLLRNDGYLTSPPKERRDCLTQYEITDLGRHVLGVKKAQQERLSTMKLPVYVPKVFSPSRPGAMDAFSVASRGF